jgi:chromosome segregation ATPase
MRLQTVLSCIITLISVSADPGVSSGDVLPTDEYRRSLESPVTPSNAQSQLSSLSLFGAPSSNSSPDTVGITMESTGTSSSASDGSASTESGGVSITAQAVVDGMDLQTCTDQVTFTRNQYSAFSTAIDSISTSVRKSTLKLQSIDVITREVQGNQDSFEQEISKIKELYNTLAVRSNALGRWMTEEKMLRDNLQELYRELVSKNTEEESRLVLLSKTMRDALFRLSSLESQMSTTMSVIASAQKAIYSWGVNVTESVNVHTTKLNSLTTGLQYRVTQIDSILPEMEEVAKRTVQIARSLGETNAVDGASAALAQIQSVIDAGASSGYAMSVPK